jgi:hypothetical protein
MYYLYHIKGIKWGCTDNLERRLKRQGYKISEIDRLITTPNIGIADALEKELNDEYGYKNQHQSYITTIRKSVKGGQSNKHAITTLLKYRHLGGQTSIKSEKHNSKQKYKCPHCSKEGNGLPMLRWHMDNCKLKQ